MCEILRTKIHSAKIHISIHTALWLFSIRIDTYFGCTEKSLNNVLKNPKSRGVGPSEIPRFPGGPIRPWSHEPAHIFRFHDNQYWMCPLRRDETRSSLSRLHRRRRYRRTQHNKCPNQVLITNYDYYNKDKFYTS